MRRGPLIFAGAGLALVAALGLAAFRRHDAEGDVRAFLKDYTPSGRPTDLTRPGLQSYVRPMKRTDRDAALEIARARGVFRSGDGWISHGAGRYREFQFDRKPPLADLLMRWGVRLPGSERPDAISVVLTDDPIMGGAASVTYVEGGPKSVGRTYAMVSTYGPWIPGVPK